jgi:hypothetical protein
VIQTGPVSSWTSPDALGPIYPFVGWEGAMALACLVLWLGWVVWQWRDEQADYDAAEASHRERHEDADPPSGG